jgi:GTPase SAR1 family protein
MNEFWESYRRLVKELVSSNTLTAIVGLITVLLTTIALFADVFGLFDLLTGTSSSILFYALGLTLLMSLLTLRTVITTANKHPKALDLALIGPPGAGKTVYLTMLYRELEVKQIKGLSFAPYGSMTIETVGNHLSQMRKGIFPPSTIPDTRFLYQARATYQTGILSRQYRIQINDFEGELLDEFNVQSDAWLHKSEYFDSVISADGLMFILDCERLLEKKNLRKDSLADIENLLVSALHIFIEKRSDDPTRPFEIPVAIIFSKSDLLTSDKDKEFVISQVPRLIGVCQNRCKYFRYFFVSALGSTPEQKDGVPIPPTELHPEGVVDPLIWFLGI